MTWASELFKKIYTPFLSDSTGEGEEGEKSIELDDLVLAVLKKNKKIQELPYPELEEYRAWRELVKKCKEVQGE